MANQQPTLEELQNDWKVMYQQTLPLAARSKLPSQPTWPVQLDHCFARIILDCKIGISTPWTSVLKSPAYKNMSREQLEACIQLGREILDGRADLVELDERSLAVRGKKGKVGGKRKVGEGDEEGLDLSVESGSKRMKITSSDSPASKRKPSLELAGKKLDSNSDLEPESEEPDSRGIKTSFSKLDTILPDSTTRNTNSTSEKEDLTPYLKKIALSSKTTFQKRVLTTLCQVPRGRYTTYGSIAKHLSSSARAVGNALRNNPFAPQVPCHRVLATGGGLGGFHGSWGRKGEEGLHDEKKRKLLREEGVKFDGRGRVVGGPWEGFT
ncbi:methylated-DNA--cysteine S-methyltransferase [Rhexocercosporidium sp. MPI-PUGE-AT-0058]|nr:methylated-DNA--cysteine S-methyltransferase [Rhexocercosporidium sp. MPI-PUGE-AT-0058]